MCISFAVMLPVGNPPNAIVFSYGHCQIKDMVSPGGPPGARPSGRDRAASLHSLRLMPAALYQLSLGYKG